eukprot:930291-Rhodomonas_salina.3
MCHRAILYPGTNCTRCIPAGFLVPFLKLCSAPSAASKSSRSGPVRSDQIRSFQPRTPRASLRIRREIRSIMMVTVSLVPYATKVPYRRGQGKVQPPGRGYPGTRVPPGTGYPVSGVRRVPAKNFDPEQNESSPAGKLSLPGYRDNQSPGLLFLLPGFLFVFSPLSLRCSESCRRGNCVAVWLW